MRYIFDNIIIDLKRKMVFIAGPRQCGKSTLAQSVIESLNCEGELLNWDDDDDRRKILGRQWSDKDPVIVFDELHKYRNWKNWIKGIFDKRKKTQTYLVTGSARLDHYRKGGDSLLGRYHLWRLHPFTLDERPSTMTPAEAFRRLMTVGGFPEPFLEGDETFAKRWRRERFDRVLHEDIRDLENVRSIAAIEELSTMLRERVGGSISYANLASDLRVAPASVQKWIEILERMYVVFLVRPYSKKLARSIQKSPKVYFYDNADVFTAPDGSNGARFENLVAAHLLKKIHFQEDSLGDRLSLRYIRDKEKREVDFVIVRNDVVEELIEVKYSDTQVSKALVHYGEALKAPKLTQIVATLQKPYVSGKVLMTNPWEYFR